MAGVSSANSRAAVAVAVFRMAFMVVPPDLPVSATPAEGEALTGRYQGARRSGISPVSVRLTGATGTRTVRRHEGGAVGPLELEAGSRHWAPGTGWSWRPWRCAAAKGGRGRPRRRAVARPSRRPSWVKVVQGCVSRLRRVLGAESIEPAPSGYRLRLRRRARRRRARGADRAGAIPAAEGAAERAVGRLREGPGAVAGPSADRAGGVGAGAARGGPADRAAPGHPGGAARRDARGRTAPRRWSPRAGPGPGTAVARGRWVTLALAQYRCGRQADALASIRTARRMLGQQLGLDPGSELAELERAILEQDPVAGGRPRGPARPARPAPGAGWRRTTPRTWTRSSAARTDVAAGWPGWTGVPLLVLAGPSGSGKSSLMKAGLVPALLLQGRRSWSARRGGPGRGDRGGPGG